MEKSKPEVDFEKAQKTAEHVLGMLTGAVVSGMIYLGDRLGLYSALRDSGPVTSEELAGKTGLHERWIREWLHGQAAAKLIDYQGGRFSLSPEAALVLADEGNLFFLGGGFSGLPSQIAVLERLPESFRSGQGLPYDAFGRGARG